MRFIWDDLKNRSNKRKHGIGFDIAAHVFLDPLQITRLERVVEGEERWQTIGRVGAVIVLVAYIVIGEEEEIIRIVSARKVTRQERIEYEEASEI